MEKSKALYQTIAY
jgi:hypothetical protein